MQSLITAINLIFFAVTIAMPYVLLAGLRKFIKRELWIGFWFCLIGTITTAICLIFLAWWSATSDLWLLKHFGFDFDGMNEFEMYHHVAAENIATVKDIERGIMGVGWPLKAIFASPLIVPLLVISYGISFLVQKFKPRISP